MAEDIGDLASALDGLTITKGPEKVTCQWWRSQSPEIQAAVTRNVERVGHTAVSKYLRNQGHRVTPPDIKTHAAGEC